MIVAGRLQKLRQRLVSQEVEAILISQPENRYYLSGFNGSSGFLLITQENAILATDFRYVEQAEKQAPDYKVFQIANEMKGWFPGLVNGLDIKKLGFEPGHITFAMYRQLNDIMKESMLSIGLVPVDGLLESIRAVKEPEEIELITRAVEISDGAFEYIQSKIHSGMTERQVAWEMEKFLREHGSQSIPFDIIVASGPNAAMPHARPSERTINAGEPVVIDLGAKVEGYSSDLTRTVCPGTPDDTFRKVYDIVLGAQMAAIAIIKEGMTGEQADMTARAFIEETGYGAAFGHSLGHGIGLAPHELPRLSRSSGDRLSPGMVFTIEPGIYLPGWGGVRIEDTVLMESTTARVLSRARKD